MTEQIQNIKKLIQIGKTEKAIAESLSMFKDSDADIYDSIIQISNRYQNIKTKLIHGEIGHGDQTVVNSINSSLLSVLNSYNEELPMSNKRSITETNPINTIKKSRLNYYFLFGAFAFGGLFSHFLFSGKYSSQDLNNESRNRIDSKISDRIGYKKCIYPNISIGFLIPDSWTQEDQVARFGGSEFELIKR